MKGRNTGHSWILLNEVWKLNFRKHERMEKNSREITRTRRKPEGRRSDREKMQAREKAGKSRRTVFPMLWDHGGSKTRLAKASGAEPASQMKDENNGTLLWRDAHLEAKTVKHHMFSLLRTLKCGKSVPRCGAKRKYTKHTKSGAFWKLRCRKSARRCGAKHICK